MDDKELFGNSEPLDDTISRQAVVNLVEEVENKRLKGEIDLTYAPMIKGIKALLSAQRWIPCSERLPKVREWVLCQCRAGIMDVLRLTEDGSWNKSYPHTEYMSGFVIAWMPLPESWEGEENGTPRGV